jgi:DNA modification methylase
VTKKPNSAIIEFKKKSNKILSNGYSNIEGIAKLYEGNAKSLSLPNECVDLIVTSPPYANNAIDYMRAHKFSLVWFGYSINRLKSKRKQFIGSEDIQNFNFISLPEFSNKKIIELSKINPKKGLALHRYFTEMYLSINEMYRVLKPDSACVIVVASSILDGIDVDTHKCLAEIGEALGFELIAINERNIYRDRRMMPASNSKNNSQIEARMHTEYVIGFWKGK